MSPRLGSFAERVRAFHAAPLETAAQTAGYTLTLDTGMILIPNIGSTSKETMLPVASSAPLTLATSR